MPILFDFDTAAPRVLLIIPRLGVNVSCADFLDATWTAADILLEHGYVQQADMVLRPFQPAIRVAA